MQKCIHFIGWNEERYMQIDLSLCGGCLQLCVGCLCRLINAYSNVIHSLWVRLVWRRWFGWCCWCRLCNKFTACLPSPSWNVDKLFHWWAKCAQNNIFVLCFIACARKMPDCWLTSPPLTPAASRGTIAHNKLPKTFADQVKRTNTGDTHTQRGRHVFVALILQLLFYYLFPTWFFIFRSNILDELRLYFYRLNWCQFGLNWIEKQLNIFSIDTLLIWCIYTLYDVRTLIVFEFSIGAHKLYLKLVCGFCWLLNNNNLCRIEFVCSIGWEQQQRLICDVRRTMCANDGGQKSAFVHRRRLCPLWSCSRRWIGIIFLQHLRPQSLICWCSMPNAPWAWRAISSGDSTCSRGVFFLPNAYWLSVSCGACGLN